MRQEDRRFTVADGMIVVAGLAILGAWLRADRDTLLHDNGFIRTWPTWTEVRLADWAPRILSAATLTWLVLRLRRPRPPLRRLGRRPGWTACASAATLIVPTLLIGVAHVAIDACWPTILLVSLWYNKMTWPIGAAVVGVWSSRLWRGRWKAEAHWLDRSGRLIGAGWVALLAVLLTLNVWRTFNPNGFCNMNINGFVDE